MVTKLQIKHKKSQDEYKVDLNEIQMRGNKSNKQKNVLCNIETLDKARYRAMKSFYDHSSMLSGAEYKTIHGDGSPSYQAK